MSFRSGRIGYARFRILGDAPLSVDEALIKKLSSGAFSTAEIGEPQELESGFVAGRHVFDQEFDPELVNYGRFLLFGLRTDVNRVPPEIARAYRMLEESAQAAESGSGSVGRRERRAAREAAAEKCRQELAQGRFRRSRLTPLLWDLERQVLLAPVSGDKLTTSLREVFLRVFGCRLQPLSAGGLAWDLSSARGMTGRLEDARPARLSAPPSESGDGSPAVPWCAGGPEPKDYLGNEFLIWLWSRVDANEGFFSTPVGEVGIVIDRTLESQSCWEDGGRCTLAGDAPTNWREAGVALKSGKWPRRIGLVLGAKGTAFSCTFQGDRFSVAGLNWTESDNARTIREETETRLERITDFDEALVGLFDTYIRERLSDHWPVVRQKTEHWIRDRPASRSKPLEPLAV